MEYLIEIAFIVIPLLLVFLLERRVRKKGTLFTGRPSPTARKIAILLGLIFTGISIAEYWITHSLSLLFPIVAAGLLAYGMGAGQLLGRLQQNERRTSAPAPDQVDETGLFARSSLMRFVSKVSIILAVSAVVIYAAYWAMVHPNSPWALVIVGGVALLFIVARSLDLFRFLRNMGK